MAQLRSRITIQVGFIAPVIVAGSRLCIVVVDCRAFFDVSAKEHQQVVVHCRGQPFFDGSAKEHHSSLQLYKVFR